MQTINHREIKRRVELDGLQETERHLTEALAEGHLKPDQFSLRQLFENTVVGGDGATLVGRDVIDELFRPGASGFKTLALMEASGAVDSSVFSNITNRLLSSKMLEGYNDEGFVFTQAVPTFQTNLNGERVAGVSEIGDAALVVNEGKPYPLAGVSEDYIDLPPTVKRGLIVPVTKEAIFFDRTGMVLRRASGVGKSLGLNKEKRIIDAIIDQNTTAHRYKWRGTSYATYQTSTPWVNKKTSNGLQDWSNVDAAEQQLAQMVDPNTGEPIMVLADTIIVTPEKFAVAAHVLNATQIVRQIGGFATSGNLSRTEGPSPVGRGPFSSNYRLMTSRLLPTRLATDTDWFLGNLSMAVQYDENWAITITQAPPNSEQEFESDIVYRFKASERGAAAVVEPRCLQWNTVA